MATGKRGLWESVHRAILHSKTLTVTTSTNLPAERIHIDKILGAFLEAAGMAELKNNLGYCVHELAGNARKANMKRLYFREKNLDILDSTDYAKGMEEFKVETTRQISHYLEGLTQSRLYVKFQFRKLKKGVRLAIRNNSLLTPAEQSRIAKKLAAAQRHTCLADAYKSTHDGAEGAGLGIVMMLFMLKNLGFPPDAFSISTTSAETVATLSLASPFARRTEQMQNTATA
jgi:hypothetical protein